MGAYFAENFTANSNKVTLLIWEIVLGSDGQIFINQVLSNDAKLKNVCATSAQEVICMDILCSHKTVSTENILRDGLRYEV
jgi:hypothetical protein